MTRFRRWWRAKVRPWFRRHRADRQMPIPNGHWPTGGPVMLLIDDRLPPAYVDAVTCAADWWCAQAGRRVFVVRWGLAPHSRSASVLYDPPLRPGGGTVESHIRRDTFEMLRAEMRLREGIDPQLLDWMVRHELGHVLGLDDNVRTTGVSGEKRYGAHALLMTPKPAGGGSELLPEEIEHVRQQFWKE